MSDPEKVEQLDALSVPAPGSGYYEWFREDVLQLVPDSAKSILSVGCAGGVTESALVRQGRRVVGLEMSADAARLARTRGLEVIEGDAQEVRAELAGQKFDFLIYADVLEHVPDPEAVLREHCQLLTPGGGLVISVPNFRHYSVLVAIFLRGEFRYRPAGIFDHTHLRITSRRSVARWISGIGFKVLRVKYKIDRRSHRLLSAITLGLLDEFLATQVLITAAKSYETAEPDRGYT